MPTTRAIGLIAAIGIAVPALSGCSQEAQPTPGAAGLIEAATDWATSLVEGNGQAACAQMDAISQRAVETATGTQNCIQAVAAYHRQLASDAQVSVHDPVDSGHTGTVVAEIGSHRPFVDLGLSPSPAGSFAWTDSWGWELTTRE